MNADLALVDQAAAALVHEFDGVLDGDDMVAAFAVGLIDDRRQGGRLTAAGGPCDDHQAARQTGQFGDAPAAIPAARSS
jgi:hypothetical protein